MVSHIQPPMPMLTRLLSLALVLVLAVPLSVQAQQDADHEAVYNAVLDYVEGIYNVQPERIERSVHPELRKLGFFRPSADGPYRPGTMPMTFDQLVNLAANWNKNGQVPEDAPKEITIYEVLDRTASAKLTAHWGIDYFHLAKFDDGTWKIINVLWQSPPPAAMATAGGDGE